MGKRSVKASLSNKINPKIVDSDRMNRVLFIAPQPFFSTRGTPINVKAMAEVLSTKGYQVTILTLPYGERVENLSINRVPKLPFVNSPPIGPSFTKLLYSLLLFLRALKLSSQFDLIHGIEEGAMIGGLVGLLTKTPYVADIDSCMVTQLQDSGYDLFFCDRLFDQIESFFLRRAKGALTVCEALSRSTHVRAPGVPIYQIEDFPMEESLVVNSLKYEEIRSRFAGQRVLLYTGNLEGYQGADLMIRSFAKFLNNSIDQKQTSLLIVGGNFKSISILRALSVELGIDSRVIFEGPRPASEMGAYMAAADFLLSPRTFGQNVPLKLYTYLAAGKPLIVTNILSHTQIVSEESAFLGEPNIDGFSLAIKDALTSPDPKQKAQKGLMLVQSKYSKEDFKKRLVEAYEQLLPINHATDLSTLERSYS